MTNNKFHDEMGKKRASAKLASSAASLISLGLAMTGGMCRNKGRISWHVGRHEYTTD